MQNPAHMAMTEALGADSTPIPFSELFMAVRFNYPREVFPCATSNSEGHVQ
ncbi:MAG: hypothetical protein ACQEUB_04640 [Thermodesulfobacteriota bacterium]